jgi:hypothetical protein
MSKIKVNEIEKASGSGITIPTGTSFTVTDGIPATNLSGTIADARLPTVPVAKGGTGLTSLGSANQQLRVNSGGNALEFATISAGGILQSVTDETASSTSTTSTSFVATSLQATITPSSTSSKIIILATAMINNNTANNWCYGTIYRDSTNLGNAKGMVGVYSQGGDIHGNGSIVWTDAPNSTSAIVYRYYFRAQSGTANFNQQPQKQKITLLELGV